MPNPRRKSTGTGENGTRAELLEMLQSLTAAREEELRRSDEMGRLMHELEVHQAELEAQNRELSETQRLLEESRNKYAELYDFAPVGYATLDRNGRIQEINLTGARMIGIERSKIIGQPFATRLTTESRNKFIEHLKEVRDSDATIEEGVSAVEIDLLHGDDPPSPIEITVAVSKHPHSGLTVYRAAFSDITERKRAQEAVREAEERLRQSQKMEAIGALAGGIAHDFNNLLTAIGGFCQLGLMRVQQGQSPEKDLAEANAAAQRAAVITRKLLAFSRRQVIASVVLDLNELLARMDDMLRRLIGENVELEMNLDPEAGSVRADPGQLEQLVMNLAVNARDAMAGGGRLEFRTVRLSSLPDSVAVPASPSGKYIKLSVSDTGGGMDSATLAHIFEPFFTTKGPGIGTGLGLSTVHGIVHQLGGEITVHSVLGEGTTFDIFLPTAERLKEAELVSKEDATDCEAHAWETILLVEDEPLVRKVASATLRGVGYQVLEASDGHDALRVASDFQGDIHILLTDVIMPRLSGPDLAEGLLTQRPAIKVLFMSGYSYDAESHQNLIGTDKEVLQKPFTLTELRRKVREVLDKEVV